MRTVRMPQTAIAAFYLYSAKFVFAKMESTPTKRQKLFVKVGQSELN